MTSITKIPIMNFTDTAAIATKITVKTVLTRKKRLLQRNFQIFHHVQDVQRRRSCHFRQRRASGPHASCRTALFRK
jgi:hypothetical protein